MSLSVCILKDGGLRRCVIINLLLFIPLINKWSLGIINSGNQKHERHALPFFNLTWWNPGTMHTMRGSSERNRISVSFVPHSGREVVITWFNSSGCCEFTQSKIFVYGILKMDGFESPSRIHANPPQYRTNLPVSRMGNKISRIKATLNLCTTLS